ncbi:MAG: hypothetical protein ACD_43C00217G0007 [uncultured bacterium]|nr:MAG: hypothetical protein ACD_43C00217G0007 [uncultured bacterium]
MAQASIIQTPCWFDILNWDSDFFGYRVVRLKPGVTVENITAVQTELKEYKVRLVYWSAAPEDSTLQTLITKLGGTLVDKKTTFVKTLTVALAKPNSRVTVTSFTATELTPELRALAIQAGLFSRFQVDQNIGYAKFAELYCLWMEKSVLHQLAEDVLVVCDETKSPQPVIGVTTVGQKNGIGDIGLVTVDEKYRGLGIASALMQAADQWFLQHNYQTVQVVTQGDNVAACRLYAKTGYTIEKVEWLYHCWL